MGADQPTNDEILDLKKARRSGNDRMQEVIICLICAAMMWLFVWVTGSPAPLDAKGVAPRDSYYNLLAQGFSAGHLYLEQEPPAGLSQLANPYDPVANAPYLRSLNDLSYYNGKLYLYFGVTPVLVLFWPCHVLTGRYLSDGAAIAILYAIGFAAFLGLTRAISKRYFPQTNVWTMTAGALALGLAVGLTVSGIVYEQTSLTRAGGVYEIAETCGFAFAALTLCAIWRAMHVEPKRQYSWLILGSFAYGLAVGSRPTLLFGAVVLLAPVVQAYKNRAGSAPWSRIIALFAAAIVPITMVGVGLMIYNELRFGDPLEFGWHYQLNQNNQANIAQFSLRYLGFNFWYYFLQPFGLSAHFPFLKAIPLPPCPSGHYARIRAACGAMLTNYPLILLVFAVPSLWKGRLSESTASLRWFVIALFLAFCAVSLTLCLFFATNSRYELDFSPELLLLAIIGFLCLDCLALGFRRRPLIRFALFLLLAYSLSFNILSNRETHAKVKAIEGNIFVRNRRLDDALVEFQKAVVMWPDDVDAHFGLATTLADLGRPDAAIAEFQKTLEINPDDAPAHENLGYGLLRIGRLADAIAEFQKALELEPESAEFHSGMAFCLVQAGQTAEAIDQWKLALQLEPGSAAIEVNLAWVLATCPDPSLRDGPTAVALAKHANQLAGGANPMVLRVLSAALAENGQYSDAVAAAQQALQMSRNNPSLAATLQEQLKIYESHQPYRDQTLSPRKN
ncbi:MAG TPA: tetratricopeptide repeat protein [Verrucomicrobiae bacterium]|nr:tetratricopeptide repeat protein [Verrucomicrobiae bacterium]